MELSGKVIIFENREEAEKWFKLIFSVIQEQKHKSIMYDYENRLKELKEQE
jgi:hypothetical protein